LCDFRFTILDFRLGKIKKSRNQEIKKSKIKKSKIDDCVIDDFRLWIGKNQEIKNPKSRNQEIKN